MLRRELNGTEEKARSSKMSPGFGYGPPHVPRRPEAAAPPTSAPWAEASVPRLRLRQRQIPSVRLSSVLAARGRISSYFLIAGSACQSTAVAGRPNDVIRKGPYDLRDANFTYQSTAYLVITLSPMLEHQRLVENSSHIIRRS